MGPGTEAEPAHGLFKQTAGFFINPTELLDLTNTHPGVGMNLTSLKALSLNLSCSHHPFQLIQAKLADLATKGYLVEKLYRKIRALRIYEGTSEIQHLVIATHLLRE